MSSPTIELPRAILVDQGALDRVAEVVTGLGLSGPFLAVCDEITWGIAGERVMDGLASAGFEGTATRIAGADDTTVAEVLGRIETEKARFVLGIGGGRPIDVAKLAGYRAGIPFLSIPTAASHDGIVSSRASITGASGKASLGARPPIAVIADTEVIAASPFRLTRSGFGDCLSNMAAVLDWRLARRLKHEPFSEYAAALAEMTARQLLGAASAIKPDSPAAASLVIQALVASGISMAIAGTTRPASGAEHMFSHRLDELVPGTALHGEQCGVGTIIMLYLHGADWQGVRQALVQVGAPTTARDLGIPTPIIIEALVTCHAIRPERYTILAESGLHHDAAEKAAQRTGVIE